MLRFTLPSVLAGGAIFIVCAHSHSRTHLSFPELPEKPAVLWRDGEHGGLNVLFLDAAIRGKTMSYSDLLGIADRNGLPSTASEITALAQRIGHPLRAAVLDPTELSQIELPVIIYLAGDTSTSGNFAVLLQIQGHRYVIADGATVAISSMTEESFLRRWNGLVFLQGTGTEWIPLAVAGFISGLCFATGIYLFRGHEQR